MPNSPLQSLALGFAGVPGTPRLHLSVDGMTEAGPNLSHWPGNRTPPKWRSDLSTGIALLAAAAPPDAQREFLQGADTVLNDHYDTDGFGALLAVLRPEVAFAREELLLAAAATGDFGCWQTWRGFAIDRIVAGLASDRSPAAAAFRGLPGPTKSLARYRWLLEHAELVLDHPEDLAAIYQDELAVVRQGLASGRAGALQVQHYRELGLAVVHSNAPVHRLVLNTLAGTFRVLHIEHTRDGPLVRYHDRTESWFELVTIQPPPRRDLRPLAARLGELEPAQGAVRWCGDPPTEPIPELYFGEPAAQEYGQVTRQRQPSRLPSDAVEREFVAFFAAPPATGAAV